jgi:hypothetical protein
MSIEKIVLLEKQNEKISQLKTAIGSLEKLIDQQPFLYVFLKTALKYLRKRVKFEQIIIDNNS